MASGGVIDRRIKSLLLGCLSMAKEKGKVILPDKEKEYWTKEVSRVANGHRFFEPSAASINIVQGLGFGVTKEGYTVCIGPVDINGDPLPDGYDTHRILKTEVLKQPESIKPLSINIQAHNNRGYETTKNVGGRPRKPDDKISRVTRWRREKEKQGVLL